MKQAAASAVPSRARRIALLQTQMRQICAHVDEHLGRPLPVGELASLVDLSATCFSREFRRAFAITPHAFVTRRRIERAQHLLLFTDLRLSRIAALCGMADKSHLVHVFRRATGLSPGAWRRRQASTPDGMLEAIEHCTLSDLLEARAAALGCVTEKTAAATRQPASTKPRRAPP